MKIGFQRDEFSSKTTKILKLDVWELGTLEGTILCELTKSKKVFKVNIVCLHCEHEDIEWRWLQV
jgi:hypothetical protein